MGDKHEAIHHHVECDLYVGRQCSDMKTVIRNVVANMESVLDDLHVIMGDITSIIHRIDTVTGKDDKGCRIQTGGKSYQMSTEHCLSKFNFRKSSKSDSDIENSIHNSHIDIEHGTVEGFQTPTHSSSNRALNVSGFSNSLLEEHTSRNQMTMFRHRNNESLTNSVWNNEIENVAPSKSLRQFSREGGSTLSPSTVIAIVHPTIINNPTFQTRQAKSENFSTHKHDNCRTETILKQEESNDTKNKASATYSCLSQPTVQNRELESMKQKVAKQKYVRTPGYKRFIQPLTSDAQQLHIIQTAEKQTQSQLSREQSISPLKSACSSVEVSPDINSSEDNARGSEILTSYYSAESDADSDSTSECRDNGLITPVTDWSYLHLVGSIDIRPSSAKNLDIMCSNNLHEMAVVQSPKSQNVSTCQEKSDVPVGLSEISRASLLSTHRQYGTFSGHVPREHNVLDNSVWTHIFCSEMKSTKVNGYCGFYEDILDSVLEDMAGFESLEQACENIDSTEVLNETLVDLDDEFEEDDWDIGLKSDHQDEYTLQIKDIHDMYGYERGILGSFKVLDDNRNVLASSSQSVNLKPSSYVRNSNILAVMNNSVENNVHTMNQRTSKHSLSPMTTDCDMSDPLAFSVTKDKYVCNEDYKADLSRGSYQRQDFIRRPHFISSRSLDLSSERIMKTDLTRSDTDMSSSDITSDFTFGSGSPMSFSSVEQTHMSSDTDHFETSSEGDYTLKSQDDQHSLSSEVRQPFYLSTHKARMRHMRRKFFKSLYRTGEKKEIERYPENYSRSSCDENRSFKKGFSRIDEKNDMPHAGKFEENITFCNKHISTWTDYTLVHIQSDDMPDSTSDIINDKNGNIDITTRCLDVDNIIVSLASKV